MLQSITTIANEVLQYDPAHSNFVTYAWMLGALGSAFGILVVIIIAVMTNYASKKVNKETCKVLHESLAQQFKEFKETGDKLLRQSGKNHDILIRMVTRLGMKEEEKDEEDRDNGL